MINFLKSFFAGEKSTEEQALLGTLDPQRPRDVLSVSDYEMGEEEEESGNCSGGGCGGCGCR